MGNKSIKVVHKLALMLSVILVCSSFTACSSSGGSESTYDINSSTDSADINSNAKSGSGMQLNNDYESYDSEADSNSDDKSSEQTDGNNQETNDNKKKDSNKTNEKLVYTCTISLETTDFDKDLKELKKLMSDYDCFIESESFSDDEESGLSYYQNYNLTTDYMNKFSNIENGQYRKGRVDRIVIRVPSDKYKKFLNSSSKIGMMIDQNQLVENITEAYYDTEFRKNSIEKRLDILKDMQDKAETLDEIVEIDNKIADLEYQLYQYEKNLSQMDSRVNYSTVYLQLAEVTEYKQYESKQKTAKFSDRLKNTLKQSFSTFTIFCESLLFFLIMWAPYIILLIICTLIIIGAKKKFEKTKNKRVNKNKNLNNLNSEVKDIEKSLEDTDAEESKDIEEKDESKN